MRKWLLAIAVSLILFPNAALAQPEVPFGEEETLRYAVNWPSGLSLGEAELTARLINQGAGPAPRWDFQFRLDAAVPGFRVLDDYRSSATGQLCSLEFEKESSHGKRKTREKTTFNAATGTAARVTLGGGGESEIPVPACPKDGLTFLYHLRRELSRGRLPAAQTMLFGAPYEISFQYAGLRRVRLGEESVDADRLTVTVKGPASQHEFELVVARDSARTPVLVKVPLDLGDFSMELVP